MAMLAIVFLLILSLTPVAKSELLGSFCGTSITDNSVNISTYQANLNLLSAEITKSSAEFLFAKGSVGFGWQTLYDLTLCFGGTTASECGDCADIAFKNEQQLCGFNMDAAIIDDMCLVRFSYADFIDSYDYQDITYAVINMMNTTAKISKTLLPGWDPGNPSRITRVMKKLLLDAYQTAAYNSKGRYLTGFMDATSTTPRLYSMAQCTPDLTPGDCMTCLQYIGDVVMGSFAGQQAGRIFSLRCSLTPATKKLVPVQFQLSSQSRRRCPVIPPSRRLQEHVYDQFSAFKIGLTASTPTPMGQLFCIPPGNER